MSAVDSQRKQMFSSEEFLTASQVAGFFSRLAAKKTLFNNERRLNVPPRRQPSKN